MSRPLSLLIFLLAISASGSAQFSRHIIRFNNKGYNNYSLGNPSAFLSSKSIERRTKQGISIDSTDLPVTKRYLDSLASVPGVTVVQSSKWLNAAFIKITDQNALIRIQNFPFVASSKPIASIASPGNGEIINKKFKETVEAVSRQPRNGVRSPMGVTEQINYGQSAAQINIHEGEFLHQKGFTGRNMTIAVLDAGFTDYDTNNALDSLRNQQRLLGGYDFVSNTNVINETNAHGMYCLSIMAANKPGQIVGSSPHAKFYLLRTENTAEEFPVEEFYWALGAEYADSSGTDIISSSLGYTSFDNPVFNNEYIDRDGNTCISTIAADLAAKKGMIVCNSAGNSGGFSTEERYVSCPADGDSVLAVGAIQANKTIAAFSSWGPNSAGKIKPDVVSIGQGTILALGNGNPAAGNGTSFSNPNLAGLVACLWEAFPEFTNMEIIDAVKQSSDRYTNPDVRFGYGIPNFRIAYNRLDSIRLARNTDNILKNEWIKALPNPFNSYISLVVKPSVTGPAKIRLFDMKGALLMESGTNVTAGISSVIQLKNTAGLPKGMYIIRYEDAEKKISLRVIRQ
jgi:hypothetical protein